MPVMVTEVAVTIGVSLRTGADGSAREIRKTNSFHPTTYLLKLVVYLPCKVKVEVALDGLLLATVHTYIPKTLPTTVRVCVYCAVTGSSNTVSVPSVTVVESLVQVTVVAGPPVEIQVRVNRGLGPFRSESRVRVISPGIVTSPVKENSKKGRS